LKPTCESPSFFTNTIDEIVEFAANDPELADGLKWLNDLAFKKGISFYDICHDVLENYDNKQKAKAWLKSKNEQKTETTD